MHLSFKFFSYVIFFFRVVEDRFGTRTSQSSESRTPDEREISFPVVVHNLPYGPKITSPSPALFHIPTGDW